MMKFAGVSRPTAEDLFNLGRLDEARSEFERIWSQSPGDAHAAHRLGIIALMAGRPAEGLRFINAAIALDPMQANYHSNRGNALRDLQRYEDAIESLNTAIILKPDYAQAFSNRANALLDLGRLDAAAADYRAAIAISPDFADAHGNLGAVLSRQGALAGAIAAFDQAIALNPANPETHHNRGKALVGLDRFDEAEEAFREACRINPGNPEALVNHGLALLKLERNDEALAAFDQALAINPDERKALRDRPSALYALKRYNEALEACDLAIAKGHDDGEMIFRRGNALLSLQRYAEAVEAFDTSIAMEPRSGETFNNRGNALFKLRRLEEALENYEKAISILPGMAGAHLNRGNALRDLNRLEEGLESYLRAIELDPNYPGAHSNVGNILRDMGRSDEAIEAYDRSIALNPDFADGFFNKSLALLTLGRFREAWPLHESRKQKIEAVGKRIYTQPHWAGEDLTGKTIFVHWEQGLGDTLQFCRYAPLVARRGGTVVFAAQKPLVRLLSQLQPEVMVIGFDQEPTQFDFHAALMSLPWIFETDEQSIPAANGYLTPDPALWARWNVRLPDNGRPRIGLVWAGNPDHLNDHNRSIRLAEILPLLDIDAEWVVLQKEVSEADAQALSGRPNVHCFGPEFEDFADTAALVSELDMVISVDTSVAHLAGALGKPVWILLPFMPDWRWMLEREDTPWYTSARLLRQQHPGQWTPVIDRLREDVPTFTARIQSAKRLELNMKRRVKPTDQLISRFTEHKT